MAVTEDRPSLDNLVAARNLLKATLDESKALSAALQKSTPSLVLAFQQPNSTSRAKTRAALLQLQAQIDCAVAPAAAVVEVFNAVRGLERSLASDPCSDLAAYLSLMNRYEEGLRLLASSCSLAIRWLEDTPEFVTHKRAAIAADEPWLESLSKSVEILRELVARKERAWLQGGPLRAAMEKLEFEFRRILAEIENNSPLPLPPAIDPSAFNKMEAILERLAMSKCGRSRLPNCVAAYVESRVGNARAMLRALDLDYLQKPVSESSAHVECLEVDMDRWCEHLEFAVKRVLEPELNLCRQLFKNRNNVGHRQEDFGAVCFEQIVTESGILQDFLRFGNDMIISRTRDSPIKLLKLVDIYAVLDRLKPDLNKLFGAGEGSACLLPIQTLARNFIEQLVCAARGIFWQLSAQVASQRQTTPPGDGRVPRVVSFVADYCNLLMGEHYKPALTQILRMGSTSSSSDEDVVGDEIRNVMNELDLSLQEWGNAYEEDNAAALSSVFAMNTRRHLWAAASEGTELGRLMGERWLRRNARLVDYHLDLYIQQSWGSLVAAALKDHSSEEDGGGVALKKKSARAFCKMVHQTVNRQSGYVMWDEELREEIRQRAVKAVVPAYRNYVLDLDGLEKGIYSAEGLEKMVRSLFRPNPNPDPNSNQGTVRCSLVGEEEEVLDFDSSSGSPMSPSRHSFSSSPITAPRVECETSSM